MEKNKLMEYKLADLIDIELFQKLLDSLNEIYSFPSAIIDNDGNVLTATAWQDICTKFHRANEQSKLECIKSDKYISENLHLANPYVSYKCPHGLIDNAIPIIIEGGHYANFFTGQFFLEPPDIDFFKKQARKFNFDEVEYLKAVESVPIWTKEKFEKYLAFIKQFTETLGQIKLRNLKEIEIRKIIEHNEQKSKNANEEFCAINEELKQSNEELIYSKEIAEKNEAKLKEQNEIIEFNNERLESLLKISQFHTNSIQELLDFALNEAIKLTNSKIGYIYFYNEETRQFILNTWSKEVMHQCTVANPQTLYDLDKTGCWGEAVRQRKPIVINDYQAENPLKKGIPEGHVKLNKFLTIPVIFDNKIVAVAGVANKEKDYDNSDIRQLSLLMDSVWKISERLLLIKNLQLAKEKAEESEQKLVEAQKTAHIGHWNWDLKKQELTWSDEIFNIFGVPKENFEVSAEAFEKTIHPEDLENFLKIREIGLASGQEINVIHRIIRPNGEIRYVQECSKILRDKHNEPRSVFGTVQDITEIKEIEIELIKAKEKAEESDRLKTAFLQNMSHEIRTPLNAISGFAGILNKPDLSEEKRKSFVSIIQNSSNQLISIVTDILTISSLETKQEKTNISNVCINNIIVELLAVFKQQAQNKNISLYAKQQLSDKQSEIYTDKTKITQILSNLLSNALKFTHEGFIEFGYNIICKDAPDGASLPELEFYVKDSGIGIKPEFHEKIFERFRQADKSINKLYGGTGLGLAISKAFVELLGGKIRVESEPEKGSIFYFTVPYKPVNEIDKTISFTKQNENFKTIIVAEDEEYNYLFIEELLLGMDLKLIHTKDGKETVEVFKSNPKIELILMDIKMPIMTGHEAAIIIKELKPDLPIIAQSAYALEHERVKYEGIFDDYLTKPINENDLKKMVTKYIAEKK